MSGQVSAMFFGFIGTTIFTIETISTYQQMQVCLAMFALLALFASICSVFIKEDLRRVQYSKNSTPNSEIPISGYGALGPILRK
jgi:hypothetical protein